ncbi:PIG-L family deacetylase [Negadavirga shengliensis]|uniref:PIG-L family deacetylase n=1 Tax=Negadavirga shengliensis TaxID=1389218 RepID=A0ABV9T0K3_9BACT
MNLDRFLKKTAGLLFLALAVFLNGLYAQTSSEIYHDLLKLKETKRVLYIAAHPDDENTRLIAYLANKEHMQVAYLSLTRGDGGQNLIGKELGIELGMIRTQELLRARETDGGKQYFSRAIDFGFSRDPDETLNNWDREKLLSDVVWVIRKFQPDVIITRFNTIPGTTHGHHTTSAILAGEAFQKAADPKVFPEQLKWVSPWKAKRIFWNAYSWGGQYEPKEDKLYHNFPVGEYNPLLGTTYSQIAADSRTMHKSQGFGATAQIGESDDFMELVDGEEFENHPFEGVANRWEELDNGKLIQQEIDKVLRGFDFLVPANNLAGLQKIKALLDLRKDGPGWMKEKREQIDRIILDVLGFKALFTSNKELSYPSDEIKSTLIANNPSDIPILLKNVKTVGHAENLHETLAGNRPFNTAIVLHLPDDYPVSQPYWLERAPENNLFSIDDQERIGKPFNDPAVMAVLTLEIEGQEIEWPVPLQYRYNDQVDGEIIQPFTVLPRITLEVNADNVFLLNDNPEEITVEVTFENSFIEGDLAFEGLDKDDYEILEKKEDKSKSKIVYRVKLKGGDGPEKSTILAHYKTRDGSIYSKGKRRILYKHIPNLTYFPPAEFNLIRLQMDMSLHRIGYIPGAGDEVPKVLADLGYPVEILDNGQLTLSRLKQYQTVIVGIRAFNVNQALANSTDQLMEYVHGGGNLIVQYNTISPLLTRELGPYPIQLSRDRITVEESPVDINFEEHPVLRYPNKIRPADFDGWVQERGLYFPGTWDKRYVTPLTMQDPDEPATKGSLLLAGYGEGTYAYSGISWFRLLPAGVPGAIKLFVNLIEQNGEGKKLSELE